MSLRRFKRKLGRFLEAVRLPFFILLGLIALGSLYYVLANLGPGRVDGPSRTRLTTEDPEIIRLVNEIDQAEKIYRAAAEAQILTPEAREALDRAITKQRVLVRTFPLVAFEQNPRLVRLEAERDNLRARENATRISTLQADGDEALSADQLDRAAELYRQALALQREINASTAETRLKNFSRETSLMQAVASVQAAPIHRERVAAETAARAALEESRWSDALERFTAARELQGRINREFPRTRFTDIVGYDRLESEIATLNAASLATEVDTKEKDGDTAATENRHLDAARLYREAFALQLEVNQRFSRSRFVSSRRLEALDVKLQTASSQPLASQLEELDRLISDDLRRRRVVAAERRIPEAISIADRIVREFPRSTFQDGALRIKLAYLSLKLTEIRQIQDSVYDRLVPLPGTSDLLMLATEVPQTLYQLVMNTNPSRNPGRGLPVESVNWNDTREFSTRMSWVLGLPVRLPTSEEFRVALGGNDGTTLRSLENSQQATGPVEERSPNLNGFRDLLGNVAEWLESGEREGTAPVVGGSYLDTEAALRSIPIENRSKTDRARHVGFRFIVVKPAD